MVCSLGMVSWKKPKTPLAMSAKFIVRFAENFVFIFHITLVTDGDTGDNDPNGDISNYVIADSALSKSPTSTFPKSTQLHEPQI